MKKAYEAPEMTVELFSPERPIATSETNFIPDTNVNDAFKNADPGAL